MMSDRGKIRCMAANIVALIRRAKAREAELTEVRAANGRLCYDLTTQRNIVANMVAENRRTSDGCDTIMAMLVQLGNLGAVLKYDAWGHWRVHKPGDKNNQYWINIGTPGHRKDGEIIHVYYLAMRLHGQIPSVEWIKPLKDGAPLAWSAGRGWEGYK